MGTRSITRVISNGKPILTFYRQMDGYPSGHGKEMADFMAGITIINGYNSDHNAGTHANGAGCFAAQLVETLKGRELGSIYLVPHDRENEEYNYTITLERKQAGPGIWGHVDYISAVKCEGHGKNDSYEGDLAGFIKFCDKGNHHDEDE